MVEKYASDAINDAVGSGKAKMSRESALSFASDGCDGSANWEAWGGWEKDMFDDGRGVLLVAVRSYVNACHYLSVV